MHVVDVGETGWDWPNLFCSQCLWWVYASVSASIAALMCCTFTIYIEMTASSLDFIHVVIYVSVTKIIKNTAAHAILPQISNILHGQHIYVSETRHVIMEHWNFTFNPASWHKVKTYEILVCACKDSIWSNKGNTVTSKVVKGMHGRHGHPFAGPQHATGY